MIVSKGDGAGGGGVTAREGAKRDVLVPELKLDPFLVLRTGDLRRWLFKRGEFF